MLSRLRSQVSPAALVIALIALFVAIGGVAGALPGKNGVNSGDVAKNTLKSVDFKNDGVLGVDVKESTLDIPAAALPAGAGSTFGATANSSGGITASTLPGTTVQKTGNTYDWRFPRSVVGCVPVASGTFSDGIVALVLGSGSPNTVRVSGFEVTQDHSLIVNCPN